jgi:hypothetical protein
VTWPEAIVIIGAMIVLIIIIGGSMSTYIDIRKAKIAAEQEDSLRQLVRRYEQLAENTQDAQQRIATDVAEMRTRVAAIEHLLRTVE